VKVLYLPIASKEEEASINQAALHRLVGSQNTHKEVPSMKRPKQIRQAPDTPATRKKRLQQRLQEISDKSEQEMAALMKSLEKVKDNLKPKKP
jgi:hypothetical protein